MNPQLVRLLDITKEIEGAVAEQRWHDALKLDQQRYAMIQQLPPQLFANANTELHDTLHEVLRSVQALEAEALAERGRCRGERHTLNQSRHAARSYEIVRHA